MSQRQTQDIDLTKNIHHHRNLLDGLNNTLIYQPVVQDIQQKLNQFNNMNYYITLLNKSENADTFSKLYSEDKQNHITILTYMMER